MIAAKISSCVDCVTSIIGPRLRCPACHDAHEIITLPCWRSTTEPSVCEALAVWLGGCAVVVVVVFLISAGRGCL